MSCKVSKELFGELVARALEELPPPFAKVLQTLRIELCGRPSRDMLRSTGVGEGQTLLGLYHGRPQTRRSVEDSGVLPDVIYLFQHELEDYCESEEQLVEQVRRTVLHEIGHHFGLGEEDLDKLGYG